MPGRRDRLGQLAALATGDRGLAASGSDHAMIREDEQRRASLASVLNRDG